MIKIILRQLFFILITIVGITFITFYLHLKSIDIEESVSSIANVVENSAQEIDKVPTQKKAGVVSHYLTYINRAVKGDLGLSTSTRIPVVEEFIDHLPASIEVVILSTVLAVIIGLPLGVIAAINHRRLADTLINHISLVAYSMPIFWWGILLLMVFSLNLGVTPVAGRLNFLFDIEPVTGFILIDTFYSEQPYRLEAFKDAVQHLILPVIVLATLPTAIIARIARQTMIETLSQDYILTAQAKGLSSFRIYWIHGLRNALIPFTNMLGLQISTLMTGAMLTEYLFAWPGIGKWMLDALTKGDYQVLQGGILLTTIMVVLINATIEIAQAWLNPLMRNKSKVYNG